MVVYAEYVIPARGFVIGEAFGEFPDVRVELDRIVPTANAVVPFVWVRGADPDEVMRVTRDHGAVQEITAIDEYEEHGTLFRVRWRRAFRDTMVTIAESDVAMLSGRGTASEWRFEFRAPRRQPLSELQRDVEGRGVPVTLLKLTDTRFEPGDPRHHLTGAQREAIRLAVERGYFEEPREVTLEELASSVGISRQAFGGRLRRGLQLLLAETFAESSA